MGELHRGRWRVGEVVFDPSDGTLWRDGRRVPLTPKTLEILKVLVEAAPRTVTREQLSDAVWPDTLVAEAALTQRVKELRQLLGDDARSPRFLETVARRGYRLIAPVEPLDEGEAVETVASARVTAATVDGGGPLRLAGGRWWRGWAGLALAAVLGLGGLGVWLAVRSPGIPSAPPAPVPSPFEPRPGVAVLELEGEPGRGKTTWVGTAVADMLVAELGAGGALRTVRADVLAGGMRELGLARRGRPTPEDLLRLRALLGVDLVVTGRFRVSPSGSPPEVALDLELREAASGGVRATLSEVGTLAGLAEVASRTGGRLRELAGVPALPPAEATRVRGTHPADVESMRLYAVGLERLRELDTAAAVSALEGALRLEPRSVRIRTTLAHALAWSGQEARARAELGRALEQASGLPREEQLALEADLCERTGEWERALEINRSLYVLYPDRLEVGLSCASLLASHGQEAEAGRVLAELRRLPEPLGRDPRVDLQEAWMHESDLTAKLAAASRAAERSRELGARLLLAAARIQQGRAYRGLGKPDEALAAFEEAWRLREAAGETAGVGKALRHVAMVERDRGQLEAAAGHLQAAAAIARDLGEGWLEVGVLRDQAALALDRGAVDEARRLIAAARGAAAGQTIPEEVALLGPEEARLEVDAGRPADGIAAARAAVTLCGEERLTLAEARARALLARCLAAAGELGEASAEAAAAARLAAATDDRATRLEVATAAAEVAAAASTCASAARDLDLALVEGSGAPVRLRLEARLVVAQCAWQAGDEGRARATWLEVAGEAERLGFRTVAGAAQGALSRLGT